MNVGNCRCYYDNSISGFLSESSESIFGKMSYADEHYNSLITTRDSWAAEIDVLKELLVKLPAGHIAFEYSIPRLGKRIDVVVVINSVVFVLEFKGDTDSFSRQNREQVWDYALDLKNFHEESHNKIIVPVLVIPNASDSAVSLIENTSIYDDQVYEPLCSNQRYLESVFESFLSKHNSKVEYDNSYWVKSRYSPTPTIVEAASHLFNTHSVEDIKRSDAEGEQLDQTTQSVLDIIKKTKERREKAICFITGVPGAGKTLVGLRIAISQFQKNESSKSDLAVYLSGNGPLVDVLTEALARDKKKQLDIKEPEKRHNITDARREVRSFIQIVHHYRSNALAKIKIHDGQLIIDESKVKKTDNDGYSEVDHVAIFDEAQRAWTKQHLANWLSRRKGINNFPMSEPEFLIWSVNLRPDWGMIVCLVGGGQEINTGEAGISEWILALNKSFPDWKIYISSQLKDREYAEGAVNSLLSKNTNVQVVDNLHLSVSMRSFRTEKLSLMVHYLLECDRDNAARVCDEIKDRYPLYITRSLDKAKEWLKEKKRGTERYGVIVSSQAYRLRPLAIDVRAKPDTVHWFLDDENDIRSSVFLEDVATEFDIQGLELDWSCVVWDGDLRYSGKGWKNYSFTGATWQNINSEERKRYQINAYRVLLTRARQGMILVVPEGNDSDHTRKKEFYDPTFNYLKSIGFIEI